MPPKKTTERDRTLRGFTARLKKEPNELKKKLLFTGYLFNRLAKQGVKAYLVGGEAVEVYTAGQFTTGDIDITVTDREKTEELLAKIGFTQTGRIWLNEDLGLAVDIVARYPTRIEKARTIEVEDLEFRVEGVEDLIIDRLTSAKHWRSNPQLDIEQATVLLTVFRDSVDHRYIKKRAAEEKVTDYLQAIEKRNREEKPT